MDINTLRAVLTRRRVRLLRRHRLVGVQPPQPRSFRRGGQPAVRRRGLEGNDMTDFVSIFWDYYVAVLSIVSIAGCAVLLWTQGRHRIVVQARQDAGHQRPRLGRATCANTRTRCRAGGSSCST